MNMNLNAFRAMLAFLAATATCGAALTPACGPAHAAEAAEPALARTAADADLAWGPCPALLPAGCAIAVLHGDPAQPNADILLKVPGGAEIAPHSHTSAERMVLVGGELLVTYEGQPEARLLPGTYAYGPAGRLHAGRCVSAAPCLLVIAFEGPVDAIPAAAGAR